jgi:hypothetical protein
MKRLWFAALAMLIILSVGSIALAWELAMKGEAEWRYRCWLRTGNNDIFGQMDDRFVNLGINHLATFPTTGTSNAGSATFGVLAGENRFGPTMSLTDYRMTIYPIIKVNPAIQLAASVNLTSLGIWSGGQPYDSRTVTVRAAGGAADTTFFTSSPGFVNSLYVPIGDRPAADNIPNTFVTLQWLKLGIKTPMLDFSIGYKDSSIGMGLWKHKDVRASSSFGVSAAYGPLKIGFSPYFSRRNSSWAIAVGDTRNTGNAAIQRVDDRRVYFQALMGEVEYSNGPLFVQIVSDSYRQPFSPTVNGRGVALTAAGSSTDDEIRYRIATAVKYNNGRFFFNAEADWYNRWRSDRGTAVIPNGPVNVGENAAGWVYGIETGCFCGPAKVTANYVRATGEDPSTRITAEDAAVAEQGVSSAYMKPWGYLMYWMYGTGTNFDADGYGQPTNYHHLGVRLDYAVASNLNFFTVYSNAWRDQPNAHRLGGSYQVGLQTFTNSDIATAQAGGFAGRAVPNNFRFVGWEIDTGVNWKLLENLTWNTTLCLWQPGNWWGAAYPNTSAIYRTGIVPNANPNTAVGEARATVNFDRNIDPLFAVETTLNVNF